MTEVDYNIKDAGKGMGMTNNQVMRMIELPLSLSASSVVFVLHLL